MAKQSNTGKQNNKSKKRKPSTGYNAALTAFNQQPAVVRPSLDQVQEGRKVPIFRRSGHLQDQMLTYEKPEVKQGNLFDFLADETITKLAADGVTVYSKEIEGIRLSDTERKLLDCINLLLHVKSNNVNNIEENKTFYTGNADAAPRLYGKDQDGRLTQVIAPMLRFKPSELYEAFTGTKDYSGKDAQNIKAVLNGLAERNFLTRYTREIDGRNGTFATQSVESYAPLYRILTYIEEKGRKVNGQKETTERKEEILIELNPIFKDQIETKYIEIPQDILKRTIIAYGNKDVPPSTFLLRDYLLRDLSHKHYVRELNIDRLPYILKMDNYIKAKRKTLIKQYIDKAIRTVINLGLVTHTEEVKGKEGQEKIIFYLNKDFLIS